MGSPEEFLRDNLPFHRMWDADKVWLPVISSGEKIRGKVVYKKGMKEFDSFEYEPLVV